MGGLTSKRRRSKKRKGSGLKGRARFEREREREGEANRDKRQAWRGGEREERELAWVPCALVSGYTSSQGSEGRYSGKFRVMQHRSSLSLSLSLSRLLFLFLPFVHSLILLSCAYSPLTILLFLRPSSPTNRLFCQFLAPFLSLFLSLSSTLERAVYKTHEVYVYVCRIHSSSSSTTPCRPAGISGLLVSSRFVSFFVSEDKPTVRSRRSRRPTAYTRTRQLLRTTRHIVYASRSLSLSLSLLARGSHVRAPSPSRRPSRFHSFSRARAVGLHTIFAARCNPEAVSK